MKITYDVPIPRPNRRRGKHNLGDFLDKFASSPSKTACLTFDTTTEARNIRPAVAQIIKRRNLGYQVMVRGDSIYVVKGGDEE